MQLQINQSIPRTLLYTAYDYSPIGNIREQLTNFDEFSVISKPTWQLISLSTHHADAAQLVNLIEADRELSRQFMHLAASSLYQQSHSVDNLNKVITEVFGFEFSISFTLHLTLHRTFKSNCPSVIGDRSLMIQALMSVELMRRLSQALPMIIRPHPREIYLTALLHNIGYALFDYKFKDEFLYLNQLIEKNPNLTIINIEQFAFNIDHGLLGTWLMRLLHLPSAVTNVIYHHHNPNYRGAHYVLNQLTFLNDCLLGQIGIGDAQNQNCPETLYRALHLTPELGDKLLEEIKPHFSTVEALVEKFGL